MLFVAEVKFSPRTGGSKVAILFLAIDGFACYGTIFSKDLSAGDTVTV